MTKRVVAEFSLDWVEIPTDYTNCKNCKGFLIDTMWIPLVGVGKIEDLDLNEINLKLCKYCYEINFKVD